jgi:glucose/arabinose dehydrogenase
VRGIENPTGMAFIDGGSRALVLEKDTGRVKIVTGRSVTGTALDLPVANNSERGLLGIALSPTFATDNLVYLSYTRSTADGGTAFDNRVERYRWNGSKLTFDRKILTMPATPGPNHNGGKITFGPDGKLYAVIGDLNRDNSNANFERAKKIDRTGAILRINPSGTSVTSNPFYDARFIGTPNEAINDVFAYGIRNSFGIAFDPFTGLLWETENGPDVMDELNQVNAGMNSGWNPLMGPDSLDPQGTQRIEELLFELKESFSIIIVTHNMQQAARVSDTTTFFYLGTMVETGPTRQIFTAPRNEQTEAYITGRFG